MFDFRLFDQVSWVDVVDDPEEIEELGTSELHETGFIRNIDGDQAFLDCDCGPRYVWRPLEALTLVSRRSD